MNKIRGRNMYLEKLGIWVLNHLCQANFSARYDFDCYSWGRREYIRVGSAAASLLPMPPK